MKKDASAKCFPAHTLQRSYNPGPPATRTRDSPSPEAERSDRGISDVVAQLAVLDEPVWTELMGFRVDLGVVEERPAARV